MLAGLPACGHATEVRHSLGQTLSGMQFRVAPPHRLACLRSGRRTPVPFAAAARAGAKGELLRLLPRLIASANTARSLALGLQPYAMGEEMSAKLLQVDQKLQASHNVLSQMVR